MDPSVQTLFQAVVRLTMNNPFSLTKANNLTDEQINSLWVDIHEDQTSSALFDAGKFTSPTSTFILGGKSRGKTHLMRYARFPLQRIRFEATGVSLVDGLMRDGYVGIYVKCSGLDTGRFKGEGQTDEAWARSSPTTQALAGSVVARRHSGALGRSRS